MLTFNEYAEDRLIESLVDSLGNNLARKNINPVAFVEQEMPEELLHEFWGMFGGKNNAHAADTSIDFKGAMQSILRVIKQVQQKGLGNRVLNFTSGSQSGQSIPLVTWLNDMVSKLGKLNAKIYSPTTPYSQQVALNQNPHEPNSYQSRYAVGGGIGLNRVGKGGAADPSRGF